MYVTLKKSQITHWWVARNSLKMAFYNIFADSPMPDDLYVMGYLDKEKEELGVSSNRVVKITKDGVITAKGTFYPYEEAHDLYLHFLIEVQRPSAVVAKSWKYASRTSKKYILADIIVDGKEQKEVLFDFEPRGKYNVVFAGRSRDLGPNVLISTFSRRDVCIVIAIPDEVKEDILSSSVATEEETREKVARIREIFAEKY